MTLRLLNVIIAVSIVELNVIRGWIESCYCFPPHDQRFGHFIIVFYHHVDCHSRQNFSHLTSKLV